MKNITDLYKMYSGPAMLFGNGPSLLKCSHIRKDSKKLFCMNYGFEIIGIENIEYLFVQEYETYETIKKIVSNEKLIIPNKPGLNKHGGAERVRVKNRKAFGYILQDPLRNGIQDLPHKDLSLNRDVQIFSYTSTSQCALHLLAYMGFNRIYLIGFDYKLYENKKIHFNSQYDKGYTEQRMNALGRIQEGDDWIIHHLKKMHDIEIINMSSAI